MDIVDALNKNTVDVEFLKKFCKEQRIKFKYQDDLKKLLFYVEHDTPNRSDITYYANGLICENVEGEWGISCFPLPNLASMKHFDKNQDYTVYPIFESMIVNVYFSRIFNKWCFGTRKSFDISTQTWRGVPYSDVVSIIDVSQLEAGHTYVFSITDGRLHLFSTSSPEDRSFRIIGKCNPEMIECFGDVAIAPEVAAKSCKSALDDYLATKKINLGYIFRSASSSVICESSLMRKVNTMIYKPEFSRENRKEKIENNNDMNYVIAKCYARDYSFSQQMFPQFIPHFQKLKEAESRLIDYLVSKYEVRSVKFNNKTSKIVESEEQFNNFIKTHQVQINSLLYKNTKLRRTMTNFVFNEKDIKFLASILN